VAQQESHPNTDASLKKKDRRLPAQPFAWRYYLLGCGLVALATLLGHFTSGLLAPTNIIMIYLLCVTVSAIFGGLGPSILVSILSVLAFDFFFIPPYLTLKVEDTQYIFTLIVLLLVGIALSYFTSRVRHETEISKRHEQEMAALYALGQDLAISNDLQSYTRSIIKRINEAMGRDVIIFLPDVRNEAKLITYTDGADINVDADIFSTATKSFQRKEIIEYGADAIKGAKALCLPLVTTRRAVGVIVLIKPDGANDFTGEQERLLSAYSDLAAVAIESIQLADELHNAEVLKATEKLQTALLNAISHDLRTPLVSIIGVLSSLQEEGMDLDDADKRNLIQVAREEADRLNHLITNLLDESRLESGAMKLSRHLAEVHDLVGATLEQLGSRVSNRMVKIDMPGELPFVWVDFGLFVQALVNILDNALKYSPPDSLIEINGRHVQQEVHIEIVDQGTGIPEQDLPYIFDKFYRIKRPDNVSGTGLGLSITKGIVEAHGGHIEAKGRAGRGTIVRIMLPASADLDALEKFNE
jgi:two-component system sensor histidine kinase KdpD